MKKIIKIDGFELLNPDELLELNGGETLWYWGLYVVGNGVRFIQGAIENPPNLPSATIYK